MSTRSAFSVTRAWSQGFTSLPQAWAGAWLVLVILWVIAAAAPHLMMVPPGHPRLVPIAVMVIAGLVKLMALGALYRLALFGKDSWVEGLGFGGVQIGRPELRLLVAGIVIGLFFLLIAAALLIVFAIATNVAGIDPGDVRLVPGGGFYGFTSSGAWLICGYVLVSLFLLVFLAVKFTLAGAATIAERRLVTLNALGLSSGNAGKLFIGLVVILAPLIIACSVAAFGLHHHFVLSPMSPALDGGFHLHMVVHAVLMALAVFVVLPLSVGFLSSAYRQIVQNRS